MKRHKYIRLPASEVDYNDTYYDDGKHSRHLGTIRTEVDSPGALTEPGAGHFKNELDENGNVIGQVVDLNKLPIYSNRRTSRSMFYNFDITNNGGDYFDQLVYSGGNYTIGGAGAGLGFPSFESGSTNAQISLNLTKTGTGTEAKVTPTRQIIYNGSTAGSTTAANNNLFVESEKLRSKYREAVIRWIRAEYDAKNP